MVRCGTTKTALLAVLGAQRAARVEVRERELGEAGGVEREEEKDAHAQALGVDDEAELLGQRRRVHQLPTRHDGEAHLQRELSAVERGTRIQRMRRAV